jgi:Zn-dependent protease with chaperone function
MTVATDVATPPRLPSPSVRPARWPTELPLFVLVLAASLLLWLMIALSIFGAIYAVIIVAALFLAHAVMIMHVRGSGVKLGPDQFPELYHRVQELGRAAGLAKVPDAYLMQQGGALNAFATKFLRARLIVLYTDLLEACGEDEGARDMVIGHELGHVKSGHLDWMWLIAPGTFVPFLGSAYSRARELTCDRWGAALCGDPAGALRGLAILSAGGKLGRQVDLAAFVRQRRDLDTGWMTIGRWLSTYPPLCERVAALDAELAGQVPASSRGPLRAAAMMAGAVMVVGLLGAGATALLMLPAFRSMLAASDPLDDWTEEADFESASGLVPLDDATAVAEATARAEADLERLAALALEFTAAVGAPPESAEELIGLWDERYGPEPFPRDPFDGYFYGLSNHGSEVYLWSAGPDGESGSDDDIDRTVQIAAETTEGSTAETTEEVE